MPDQDRYTSTCDWCGNSCDTSIQAIKHRRLTFITNGVVEDGEATQEILKFCSRQHRVEYFCGL